MTDTQNPHIAAIHIAAKRRANWLAWLARMLEAPDPHPDVIMAAVEELRKLARQEGEV